MELRIRTMSIRAVMIQGDITTKVTDIVPIINHILLGVIRAVHDTGLCTSSRLIMLAGNDIHDTSHSVRTV